jgi:hypothetical protein
VRWRMKRQDATHRKVMGWAHAVAEPKLSVSVPAANAHRATYANGRFP